MSGAVIAVGEINLFLRSKSQINPLSSSHPIRKSDSIRPSDEKNSDPTPPNDKKWQRSNHIRIGSKVVLDGRNHVSDLDENPRTQVLNIVSMEITV